MLSYLLRKSLFYELYVHSIEEKYNINISLNINNNPMINKSRKR